MRLKKEKLPSLDYLLIPSGWGRQRKKRALEEIQKREIKNIFVLNGCDSEEDILYIGRKLKKGNRIGIVTFPLHYKEYTEIIKKAQKDKNFPKGIKVENIRTNQTVRQTIYGILGLIEERLDKKVNYVKEEKTNFFIEKIKQTVKILLKGEYCESRHRFSKH
jgi:hypothetical protein